MALVALSLCLLLVAQCTDVMAALPNPDECISKGLMLPDTENCRNFYMCKGEKKLLPDSYSCGYGFTCFKDTKCVTTDPCDPVCNDDIVGPSHPQCKVMSISYCEDHPGSVVYNKEDCSKYSLCLGDGGSFDLTCDKPEEPYFNGHGCGNDKSACCNCYLDECTEKGGLIRDPNNCKQYYACVDLDDSGALAKKGPSMCEAGSFNLDILDCDPTILECENTCGKIGGGGSTTPGSTSIKSTTVRTTTTDDVCIDLSDFTCLFKGNYTHCSACDPSYINCDNAASTPTIEYCSGNHVFNTNPVYPFCIKPENCPFPQ